MTTAERDYQEHLENLRNLLRMEKHIRTIEFVAQATYYQGVRQVIDIETAYPYPQPSNLALWS